VIKENTTRDRERDETKRHRERERDFTTSHAAYL